jgi:hydroxyacylglutathione hydrolase
LKIIQFRYGLDNLSYIVHGSRTAAVIDGGAVEEIVEYLRSKDLELRYVANTHSHPDHTMGTQELVEATGATLLGHEQLVERGVLDLDGTWTRGRSGWFPLPAIPWTRWSST